MLLNLRHRIFIQLNYRELLEIRNRNANNFIDSITKYTKASSFDHLVRKSTVLLSQNKHHSQFQYLVTLKIQGKMVEGFIPHNSLLFTNIPLISHHLLHSRLGH